MPIYEYRCSSCGHELEALQKFSDAPLVACPACAGNALVKLVSAAGFQLKGSGWYATDFKGSGSKPAAKTEGGDGKPAAKAEGGDGKAAAKAEGGGEKTATTETKSAVAAPAAPAATGAGRATS